MAYRVRARGTNQYLQRYDAKHDVWRMTPRVGDAATFTSERAAAMVAAELPMAADAVEGKEIVCDG